MEVMLIPLLILFFILVAGFGIENTFKILPPLIILGLLIYFLGWVAVRYFWIILPILFGGNTYSGYSCQNGSSSYQRTTNTYTTDKSKYYTILGVSKNASQDEIRKAYHKLAKEHHPDKFVNSSDSEKKYHENKMKEINDAYENLTK